MPGGAGENTEGAEVDIARGRGRETGVVGAIAAAGTANGPGWAIAGPA